MTWVRIDEDFAHHPKLLRAGPLAGWLHVCALCYANHYLTDGFIPAAAIATLADFDGISVETGGTPGLVTIGRDIEPYGLAARLLDCGLWEETAGGYQIHDYLDYNPSAEKVKAERDAARRRMQGRRQPEPTPSLEVRPNSARSSSEVPANNERTSPKVPEKFNDPVPDPVRSTRATNQIAVNGTAPSAATAAFGGVVELPDLWTERYATVVGRPATDAERDTLAAIAREGLALDSIELGEALGEALATPNCRSPAGLARTILQRWRGDGPHLAPQWTDSNVPPSRRTET